MTNKNNLDQSLWDFHQTKNANDLIQGHSRQNYISNLVFKKIRESSKILEIGFGDAYLLKKLSANYQCYGADISPKNIQQMKIKFNNIKFDLIKTDGKLPYKENYFDAFIASEVLEHMDDEELKKCITEIHRILKPNGIAIITIPAKENLNDNTCYCPKCKHTFHKWGHKQSFNEEKINNLFNKFLKKEINIIYTRYKGKTIIEKMLGYIMWTGRTIIGKITYISGGNYLIKLKK